MTNEKGKVVWLADYDAWGNISEICKDFSYVPQTIGNVEISSEDLQPIRFQGQFYDVETGLHYNRFRYYDSDLGMFISRDPIGLMGGNNVFQYAPNPVGWIDPWGLESLAVIAIRKAAQLRAAKKPSSTKVSVVRDKVTGKTYIGVNGDPHQKIDSALEKHLPKNSKEGWRVTNCAEVDALNQAFRARKGAKMSDMKIVTIQIGTEGQPSMNKNAPPCSNCSVTTKNASVVHKDKC